MTFNLQISLSKMSNYANNSSHSLVNNSQLICILEICEIGKLFIIYLYFSCNCKI